jgi:hypothetical protein
MSSEPTSAAETAQHEYEPSEHLHPMRSDPDCDFCGQARNAPVHGGT